MRFTWDVHKRAENLQKHHIDFVEATAIFDGPTLEIEDDRHDEYRVNAIGTTHGRALFVSYVPVDDETYHIISARRAEPHERKAYFREFPTAW